MDQREEELVRLGTLFDIAPDAVFVADFEGRYTDVNAAACRMLGYSKEELVGKTIVDLIPPEDVPRLWRVRDALRRGGSQTADWRLRRKDGTFVDVEISANVHPDGRWIGVVRDITDHLRALHELQLSQQRLDAIVSSSADAIICIDHQRRIILYNEGAERIFGWSRAEMMGRALDELIPERLRQKHTANIEAFALTEGATRRMGDLTTEIVGLRRTGEQFPAEASISKIAVAGGPMFTVTLRDISERRAAEEALRVSEERLRLALLASPAMMFNQDLNLRYTWVHNPRPPYAGLEVQGKSDFEFFTVDDAQELTRIKRKVLETGTGARTIVRTTTGGEIFHYDLAVEPLREPGGRVVGITGAIWDVTEERRDMERQHFLAEAGTVLLSASLDRDHILNELGRLAVRDLADWFLVEVLEGGRIRRLRVAYSDPSKRWVADALMRMHLDRSRPYLLFEAIQRGQPTLVPEVNEAQLQAVAQSEEHLGLLRAMDARSMVAVPLVSRGVPLGAFALVSSRGTHRYGESDVRFAQELARELALAVDNAQLFEATQRAIAARDDVLGIVAHDLRGPLNTILLHSELLRRSDDAPERRNQRPVEAITRAGQRMNRLIQDMLDVARLEAGAFAVDRAPVVTTRLLDEALNAQSFPAASARLQLRLDASEDLPEVLGDYDRLLQVFDNLIGNAIKFTPAGKVIVVGATPREAEVLFWVADNGPGIPPEQLPNLFDRFWQARTSDRRGAGLGLAIVKGIIDGHGGRVWVESQPGRGTTFFFTVPVARAAEAHAPGHG